MRGRDRRPSCDPPSPRGAAAVDPSRGSLEMCWPAAGRAGTPSAAAARDDGGLEDRVTVDARSTISPAVPFDFGVP